MQTRNFPIILYPEIELATLSISKSNDSLNYLTIGILLLITLEFNC